ncbi:MAG: DUF1841 family protein [Bacteroidetes bacterium]|nr:DUF1841 family protein [Bacteroidota bacterium]
MDSKKILRDQFLQVVENQLSDDNPPETKETYLRLQKEGYSKSDSKILIAQCVAKAIYDAMTKNIPFNNVDYVKNLNKLPEFTE